MIKQVNKKEEQLVLKWLKGETSIADLARSLKIDPRSTKPYVRITKTIKKLYMDRTIIILKQ